MNNKLKANLASFRPQGRHAQTPEMPSGPAMGSQSSHPSLDTEYMEECRERHSAVPSKVPFAFYQPNLNPDEDIMSMDFCCRGAENVLPAPTTILERPRAPPTPPLPVPHLLKTARRERVRPQEPSSRAQSPREPAADEKSRHRLKLTALFNLSAAEAKERRQQEDAELQRRALEASRQKFEAKRQRNLERDREREYLVRKEAERKHAQRESALEEEYYEPIIVDMGASSSSRSDHWSNSKNSHSHCHSHSHSKSHSHSHSRSKDHQQLHTSSSHKHKKDHHSKSHNKH